MRANWRVTVRGDTKGHELTIAAFKKAVWRVFKPTYDPVADGMLKAYHKQQYTEQAIKTELQRLIGKPSHR